VSTILSLGEVFGSLRLLPALLSSCGQLFLESCGLCLTTSKNFFIAGKLKGGDIPKRLFGKLLLPS
jgi:hypothetical protein